MSNTEKNVVLLHFINFAFFISLIFLIILFHRKGKRLENLNIDLKKNMNNLEKKYLVETNLIGKKFPEYELEDSFVKTNILNYFKQENFLIIIISSFASCSICRENEIKLWNNYKELKVIGIVSDCISSNQQKIKIQKFIRTLRLDYPWLFDRKQLLLSYCGASPEQSPIILLINKERNILFSHCAVSNKIKESMQFQKMITRVSKYFNTSK